MPTLRPFYIAYEENAGIDQILGEKIPNLRAQLENYGSGLDVEGNLRGGPLVTSCSGIEGVVLCWIRGVRHARKNIWEAWGVVAPDPTSIIYWPSHWTALKEEPSEQSINNFAAKLTQGWGNSWPEHSGDTVALISMIHRVHLDDNRVVNFRIPINQSNDISALAWLWLFGPIQWISASIGPPRRTQTFVTMTPTYEGIIDRAAWTEKVVSSPFIRDLFSMAQKGEIESAVQSIEEFRQQEPGLRRKRLDEATVSNVPPVPAKALIARAASVKEPKRRWLPAFLRSIHDKQETAEEMSGSEEIVTSIPQENTLRVIELKINFLLLVVSAIFIMCALDYSARVRDVSPAKEESQQLGSTTQPAARVDTTPQPGEPEKTTIALNHGDLERMHGKLLRLLSLEATPDFQAIDAARVEDDVLRERLATAAVQTLLLESDCAPAGLKIGMNRGPRTNTSIERCNNEELKEISRSEQEALKWLHSWLLLRGDVQ